MWGERAISSSSSNRPGSHDTICIVTTWISALQVDPMNLSTFQMLSSSLLTGSFMPTSGTSIARPQFQSLNHSRTIGGWRTFFQSLARAMCSNGLSAGRYTSFVTSWRALRWRRIRSCGKPLLQIKANESAIFGFTSRTLFQSGKNKASGGFWTVHGGENNVKKVSKRVKYMKEYLSKYRHDKMKGMTRKNKETRERVCSNEIWEG